MHQRLIVFFFVLFLAGAAAAFAQEGAGTDVIVHPELKVKIDVFRPDGSKGKLPTVFVAHNGFAKKEDWGTFPRELADKGYLVANIGWVDMAGTADVDKAIRLVLEKYGASIDAGKVAFIGGCHGAVKLLTLTAGKALPAKLKVKSAVALSVSEEDSAMLEALGKNKIPVLAVYSTKDKYGYAAINTKFAEELLREPKKVLALDARPHGNEMLTDAATKAAVSREIIDWLKKYVK
ncbi:MAG: hypothetical protein JXD23_10920 [Spirochaetales bacterium]|nr:hypothetical protein [Spirochaetales bacterium]